MSCLAIHTNCIFQAFISYYCVIDNSPPFLEKKLNYFLNSNSWVIIFQGWIFLIILKHERTRQLINHFLHCYRIVVFILLILNLWNWLKSFSNHLTLAMNSFINFVAYLLTHLNLSHLHLHHHQQILILLKDLQFYLTNFEYCLAF
jgi:hypothetical protein